ncbi:hypothetical protein SRHO_G00033480 [Serrasalmus rhombeus]
MPYTAANTSTMKRHLQHHHSTVLKSTAAPVKKTSQTTLTNTFGPQLPQSSVRATAITRDIGVFIAADMRPFSVVENQGFRRLLHTLEPKYTIPSRTHFTRTVIPNLYEESKSKIVQILKDAASIAITTDGWTSRVVLRRKHRKRKLRVRELVGMRGGRIRRDAAVDRGRRRQPSRIVRHFGLLLRRSRVCSDFVNLLPFITAPKRKADSSDGSASKKRKAVTHESEIRYRLAIR